MKAKYRSKFRTVLFAGVMGCLASPALYAVTPEDAVLIDGPEAVYQRTCGYCHGHNVGPDIEGRGLPVEYISALVRGGRGAMPAFRPTEISNTELADLARWLMESKASGQP